MMRKYLNTLAALIVLGGLWGASVYLGKRKLRETSSTASKPAEKIVQVHTDQIHSFTIKPKGGDPFTCRLEGGKWSIIEPERIPADASSVSSFLSSLSDATVDEVVNDHPSSLKEFGLDPPFTTIEVSSGAKPANLAIHLGDETPTGNGVYAEVGGSPRVVTLASYLKSSLEKTLFDFRDKHAITLDVDQIRKIEVKWKDKRYALEKNPEGVWDLVLPPAVRANQASVSSLVSGLRTLSMASIVAENRKKSAAYGLGSPTMTIKVTSPAASQTLVLGKKDGDRFDAANLELEPIFTLNSSALTDFQKDASELRDKDLFSFSTFEAKRLEIKTPQGHWVFEQQKDKWKQTAPSLKDVTTDKMDSLLEDVRDLRAESFPKGGSLASFNLATPAYRFQAQFGEKKQQEIVEAAKAGAHVYARRSTDPLPSELSKTALDPIEKALGDLK